MKINKKKRKKKEKFLVFFEKSPLFHKKTRTKHNNKQIKQIKQIKQPKNNKIKKKNQKIQKKKKKTKRKKKKKKKENKKQSKLKTRSQTQITKQKITSHHLLLFLPLSLSAPFPTHFLTEFIMEESAHTLLSPPHSHPLLPPLYIFVKL